MATRDMEGTIRFWRDLLGMRLVGGLGKKGYKLYFFEICSQNYVVFFEWPTVESVPEKDHGFPVLGPAVFDHVSFAVENDESLFSLRQALDAAGFWVSDVIDHGIIHSIYCFDPNGIPIEFSAPVAGADLGADPRLVDTDPVAAALEGAEPVEGIWPAPTPESVLDPGGRRIYPGEGENLLDRTKKNRFSR
jgi:catechol 2,3-dioxygenase-like lactoylglutathione lyase family enzyme